MGRGIGPIGLIGPIGRIKDGVIGTGKSGQKVLGIDASLSLYSNSCCSLVVLEKMGF